MTRVFITYSHDSNAHVDRVLALADRLRADGLDVRLDQYEVEIPEGWIKWMERQLDEADFVLVVCTETYRRRFDGREATGVGLAATHEGALVQQFIYDAGSQNYRFIPIVFEDGRVSDIPRVLGSATRYRLHAAYEDLYRHLTGQPRTPPPPIGKIRPMPPAPRPGLAGTSAPPLSAPMSSSRINNPGASSPLSPTRLAPAPPVAAKILLVTANASDQAARLLLDEESRAIIDALQRARLRDRYDLRLSPAITFDRLIHDLDDHAPPFIHFSGHGDRDGALILQTADRYDHRVPPENIGQLFAALRRRPELVVFATCYSRDLAQRVAPHVGYAIGFTGPLDDDAARHFSAVLYERLAAHEPPDIARAFTLARIATVSAGYPEVDGACLFAQTDQRPGDPMRAPAPADPVGEPSTSSLTDGHSVTTPALLRATSATLEREPLAPRRQANSMDSAEDLLLLRGSCDEGRRCWDAVGVITRILSAGPRWLVEALDRGVPGDQPTAVGGSHAELARRVAENIDALGPGNAAAAVLLRVCDGALFPEDGEPAADFDVARDSVRELLCEWMPRRYDDGAAIERSRHADCPDLRLATASELVSAFHVSGEDDLSAEIDGARLRSTRSLELPAAIAGEMHGDDLADKIVEDLLGKRPEIARQGEATQRDRRELAAGQFRRLRRRRKPRDLTLSSDGWARLAPPDARARLKEILPMLRQVETTASSSEERALRDILIDIFSDSD